MIDGHVENSNPLIISVPIGSVDCQPLRMDYGGRMLGTKVTDSPIRDICDCPEDKKEIRLVILECFDNLVWFQGFILDSGLVRTKPLNS